jgi:hypothetical protein
MAFIPCVGCGRHVRADDASCPFCGASVPEVVVGPAVSFAGLGRAAIMALGATLAGTAIAGCESEIVSVADAYGAPFDAGVEDAGGPAPAYGAPFDAGVQDAGSDAGGTAPAYGAPFDAGQ